MPTRLSALFAAIVLLGALAVPAGPASAAFTVRLGVLTCDIEGRGGFILGSHKLLACTFNPAGNVPRGYYEGSITRIGLDVGATGGAVLAWLVLAPTNQLTPGFLEGRYYGVGAEATPGVGIGANILIGGFDRSIVLQPISLQGQGGANVAAGIAGLRLIDVTNRPEPGAVYKR